MLYDEPDNREAGFLLGELPLVRTAPGHRGVSPVIESVEFSSPVARCRTGGGERGQQFVQRLTSAADETGSTDPYCCGANRNL